MTRASSDLFLVAGDISGVDIGSGKRRLLRDASDDPVAFSVLDCFDRPIGKSGRVLIDTAGRLLLCGGDGILEQAADRSGDFAADLAEGPVRAALADVSPLRSLLMLGQGRLRTARLTLIDDQRKTQARARLMVLEPEGGGRCVTLISVRGLRGYDKARDWLIAQLRAAADGVAFGDLCQVLFPGNQPYDPKPDIPITTDATALETANDIIATYLAVARRNEPGVIADHDTEFLHDYRVALRKIRSVLSLFKGVYDEDQTRALKQAFSDLMAPTGRMRDLDVYLLDRHHYFDLLPESLHPGLAAMFEMFAQERKDALSDLRRRFKSNSYKSDIKRLAKIFKAPCQVAPGPSADRPAHGYACALIWERYRKVCKIAAGIDADTEDEEVHALRIHCKKLRYLMEFFAPLFADKDIKALIKPLKRLQDNLGLFNDYSVQQLSLQAFMDSHAAKGRRTDLAIAQSIGALIAVLHQRQLEERARVVASFARFDSPKLQRKFRRLFHEEG